MSSNYLGLCERAWSIACSIAENRNTIISLEEELKRWQKASDDNKDIIIEIEKAIKDIKRNYRTFEKLLHLQGWKMAWQYNEQSRHEWWELEKIIEREDNDKIKDG